MEEHIVRILNIEQVTHDVRRIQVEKPSGYSFIPGQATEVSVNSAEFKDRKSPFTFTCLNSEAFLEFTIKIYPEHNGVTNAISKLKQGDDLIIRDVWGAISYKGEGVFIAGGAGVTPFISIFRDLKSKNQAGGNILLFANKTRADIILEKEFKQLLGPAFINILSEEKASGYSYGIIGKDFLAANIKDFSKNLYICGPPPMMDSVLKLLDELGADKNLVTVEL